jgi:cytochrome c oxidase cbb3-type subunit 4
METFDVNDIRTLVTALSFIVFAGIVFWAYSSRQKARFDEAANLPFADAESELPHDKQDNHDNPVINAMDNRHGVRS